MATYRVWRIIGSKLEIIASNLSYEEAHRFEILYANVFIEEE